MRARVRGIYATALTRTLLDAGHDVVQASQAIDDRFDADFENAAYEVSVATSDDRQGVRIEGEPDAVDATTALLTGVGVDALAWAAVAPGGAVFDGRVTETLGGGAVVGLGETEGFLPYDSADGYVDDGDELRVQVARSAAPWEGDRPLLGTELCADGGLARLVRGREGVDVDGRDDEAGRELAGMTELLDVETPEGWGVRWRRSAVDADMDALRSALERAAERARDLDPDLDAEVVPPRRLAAPLATTWVWFGRESRFALDERRRTVTPTMPGHHRTKAASEAASAGVDLAEALCPALDGGFPFGVVARQFGPTEGDTVAIGHGKPGGRLVVLGRGEVVEFDGEGTVAVRREMTGGGEYDGLGVPRAAGDTALTKFREGRWWYPTVYRDAEGEVKGTYVNVCTPVECFPDAVRYVDLHVDVVRHPDGRVDRLDDDELDDAVAAGHVPEALAEKARSVATSLENAL